MENVLYWLWLTLKPRMTSTNITHLLEHFETIQDIYETKEYKNIPSLTPGIIATLNDKSLDKAYEVYKRVEEIGAKILVFDDKDYPDMLRNIIDPPYVLYVKGEVLPWDRLFTIGVVGTRECDGDGRMNTINICRDLAKMGVTIVSGMARGIDGAAAEAALRMGAKTIAVLGCGVDVVYPPEHDKLYESILANGAVISEYPPGMGVAPWTFPARNRIIAGLSRGVLVTQAPKRSGALITARCAFENNRDVFAIPGSINDANYVGCNQIIQSYAKLVMNACDVVNEYPYDVERINLLKSEENNTEEGSKKSSNTYVNSIKVSIDDKKYSTLKSKEKEIIKLLIEGNMHIDEIIRSTNIPAGELNTMMVLLEMNGMVKKLPGNNYKLKL